MRLDTTILSDIEARPNDTGTVAMLYIYILDQLYRGKKIQFAADTIVKYGRLIYLVFIAYAMQQSEYKIHKLSPMNALKFCRYDRGPSLVFDLHNEKYAKELIIRGEKLTPVYRFVNESLSPVDLARLNNAIKTVRKNFIKYDTYDLNAITCDVFPLTRRVHCYRDLDMCQKNINDECRAMAHYIQESKQM